MPIEEKISKIIRVALLVLPAMVQQTLAWWLVHSSSDLRIFSYFRSVQRDCPVSAKLGYLVPVSPERRE